MGDKAIEEARDWRCQERATRAEREEGQHEQGMQARAGWPREGEVRRGMLRAVVGLQGKRDSSVSLASLR